MCWYTNFDVEEMRTMSRRLTIVVLMTFAVLALVASVPASAEEVEPGAASTAGAGLDKPEDLATLKGLCYPGLSCPIQVELDAGLLSMLRPVLEQLLQGQAGVPEPLDDLGKALEKMGPEAREILLGFLERIKGFALAIQMPLNGEVNVSKVTTYYLQRALSVGWKPVLHVNKGPTQSIALFQLPTPVPSGGTAELPQGFVLAVVTPQQVITVGVLGQIDLSKLLPLLSMLKNM